MGEKKLYLSGDNKKLFGVCGGLAEYLGVDATIIRLIWAIFAFAYGAGIVAYFIAALVMPKRPY